MLTRFLLLLLFTPTVLAGPWWTGPLLAPAGTTVPAAHFNFEPYVFYTDYPQGFNNLKVIPILTAGINSFMDIQTSLPYDYSWAQGQHGNGIGDYSLAFGFQLLRQKESTWLPDLRFVIQEVFPTGRYDQLNPRKLGTDQTGIGSYQTFLGLNFQKVSQFQNEHYLRTRLSLVSVFPSAVRVYGTNTFGGAFGTIGKVHPGNSYSVDLAFEYTLTQNWVPVMEVLYVNSEASDFTGRRGFTPGGTAASVGGSSSHQASIAPALEYNFSPDLGVIGGVWLSVSGPHAAKFVSTTVAINYSF